MESIRGVQSLVEPFFGLGTFVSSTEVVPLSPRNCHSEEFSPCDSSSSLPSTAA